MRAIACIVNNKLYAFGGSNTANSIECCEFLKQNKWKIIKFFNNFHINFLHL